MRREVWGPEGGDQTQCSETTTSGLCHIISSALSSICFSQGKVVRKTPAQEKQKAEISEICQPTFYCFFIWQIFRQICRQICRSAGRLFIKERVFSAFQVLFGSKRISFVILNALPSSEVHIWSFLPGKKWHRHMHELIKHSRLREQLSH